MDSSDKTFSPPYNVPFATVLTTTEKVGADLPTKLDRSYLGSASGGLKSYLISAFKGLGLIREDLTVTEELKEAAGDDEKRRAMFRAIIEDRYPLAVALGSTNSTPGELQQAFAEMFPGITGESREKAIRFFLSASEYAGLPKSPLWKTPKAGNSGPRKKSTKPRGNGGSGGGSGDVELPVKGQSLRTFTLPSGRSLTIALNGDVLALDRTERKFVMSVIDMIEEHVEAHGGSASTPAEDEP